MAGFVAGHVGEALSQERVLLLDPAAQFLVKQKTGKLRGAALLQKLNEDLAGLRIQLVGGPFKFFVANEVVAVVILAKFLADRLEFSFVWPQIHRRHGVEICGVEARREDGVLGGILHGGSRWGADRRLGLG